MQWPGLFRGIPLMLRASLPADRQTFQWSATNWQVKAWYGNRALHYEITVRYSAKVVELGLHFESDALTNARLLGAFRARAKDVKGVLGPDVRLEEWDRGWCRVWEPIALEKLDAPYAERIQTRFVDYVRLLEPMLREELPADVIWKVAPPKRAARVTSSRRSRSGKR